MSDLAHHQTEAVQFIFLGMGKSDIIHTDHNYVDNIIVSKFLVLHEISHIWYHAKTEGKTHVSVPLSLHLFL